MPPLPAAAIPSFLSRLSSSLPSSLPSPTRYLVPLLTSTALGHASLFLKPSLDLALSPFPPAPSPVPPEPADPREDWEIHPRRATVLLAKEALVKSAILVGVPRAIEALLELRDEVDDADWSGRFVRKELDAQGQTIGARKDAGREGLGRVYQRDSDAIFERMRVSGLDDLRFLSQSTTYGTFLTPFPSPSSPSPNPDPFLSHPSSSPARLFPLLTLPPLLALRTPREIHWHLRGALRCGWTKGEVEALQGAVESVAEACGVEQVGEGMPRVRDVDRQKEEDEREGVEALFW
ncbi:hypothetical protein JCM6882_001692 [Rhodosporidiobolus microsporus]